MKNNESTREELIKLLSPIIEWMDLNLNPHCKLIIDSNSFELVSGEIAYVQDLQQTNEH